MGVGTLTRLACWHSCMLLVLFGVSFFAAADSSYDARTPSASPMHVGIMCIPLYGHLKPLSVVGDALARRGHHVTYFVEGPQWCEAARRQPRDTVSCIIIPSRGAFANTSLFHKLSQIDNFFLTVLKLLDESFRHHNRHLGDYLAAARAEHIKRPFSMIMRDMTTFVGDSVATALGIPCVVLSPFTTLVSLTPAGHLPLIGFGWPLRMNTWQRVQNYFMQSAVVAFYRSHDMLNRKRVLHNITPLRNSLESVGWYDPVLIPTVWGFDIPQELCPNFYPLGLLNLTDSHALPLEDDLAKFLNNCTTGTIYVNFGTLAIIQRRQLGQIAKSLQRLPYCIVWKLGETDKRIVMQNYFKNIEERTYFRSYFLSPSRIMSHEHVVAFISHCGDTSVYEALSTQLPIVGIPFFADQADVCQRLEESGIGKFAGHKNHFTSDDLLKAIQVTVQRSSQIRDNMKRLLLVSKFLGGAERAVEILEDRYQNALLGRNESLERCVIFNDALEAEMGLLRRGQFDVLLLWLLVFVPFWLAAYVCLGKTLACISNKFWGHNERRVKGKARYDARPRVSHHEKGN